MIRIAGAGKPSAGSTEEASAEAAKEPAKEGPIGGPVEEV